MLQAILIFAALVVAAFLIAFAVYRTRDNWFRKKEIETRHLPPLPDDPNQSEPKPASPQKNTSKVKEEKWWRPKLRTVLIFVAIALTVVIVAWRKGQDAGESDGEKVKKARTLNKRRISNARTDSRLAPVDIAAAIISGCESGNGRPGSGRQFEKDGRAPLKNKERASSAAGKYQFIESHREPARKLGFNLDTEAGQDGYFQYRYGVSGTRDWEADPRSRACWEPQLIAAGYGPAGEAVEYAVMIPTDQFSGLITVPDGYNLHFDWGQNNISVLWNENEKEVEDLLPDDRIKRSNINSFRIKSREEKPIEVKVRLTPISRRAGSSPFCFYFIIFTSGKK